MIAALLLALTVGQVGDVDAGTDAPFAQLDHPLAWTVPMGSPDGGVAVCLDEATAIADARELVGYRAQAASLDAAVKKEDPAWLRIAVVAVVGLAAGAALTFGVMDATRHVK